MQESSTDKVIMQQEECDRNDVPSDVTKWILSRDTNIPHRWKKIGKEVYARKSLLFAAANDLKSHDIKNSVSLAATDVFVEKAQKLLSRRALWNMILGGVMSVMTFIMLILASIWLYELNIIGEISKYGRLDNLLFTLLVLKATTAGAIFGAATYFAIALSRAFLHEGTVLYSRRHALRFGRLYVYLVEGKVEFKDLEEAFKWNAEFTSAFKDIKPEKAAAHPAQRVLQEVASIIRESTALAGKVTGKASHSTDHSPNQAIQPDR